MVRRVDFFERFVVVKCVVDSLSDHSAFLTYNYMVEPFFVDVLGLDQSFVMPVREDSQFGYKAGKMGRGGLLNLMESKVQLFPKEQGTSL